VDRVYGVSVWEEDSVKVLSLSDKSNEISYLGCGKSNTMRHGDGEFELRGYTFAGKALDKESSLFSNGSERSW